MDDPELIYLKIDLTFFNLFNCFSYFSSNGSRFWVWHKTSWSQYFSKLTNLDASIGAKGFSSLRVVLNFWFHQAGQEIARSEEGIVASEAANNATVGGALIPLIAMGIPGSVIDAILIGALTIHSIQPGPTLFLTNSNIVWGMIATALLANILMWLLMTSSLRYISNLIYLPRSFVLPVVMMFCVIGSYALNNTMFDVWVMLLFGAIGFLLERARIPLGPFVIGFVLAPLAEEKLRSGLMMTAGDISPIVTRPFSLAFTITAIVLLLWPLTSDYRKRRRLSQ